MDEDLKKVEGVTLFIVAIVLAIIGLSKLGLLDRWISNFFIARIVSSNLYLGLVLLVLAGFLIFMAMAFLFSEKK